MRLPHNSESQWNRRTRTTSQTGLPAKGRSAKRRRYRLWIRSDLIPQPGQALAVLRGRIVDERRVGLIAGGINNKTARNKARRSEGLAHGIDSFCETNATLVTMPSKLSQSQYWTPIWSGPLGPDD
jgi:hypothetical protein